jgi:streptomycin 6-kinase
VTGAPHDLLDHWHLRADGMPCSGWMSRVWPVLGPGGQRWVLKVPRTRGEPTGEAEALRAWSKHPRSREHVVGLVDHRDGALLLERLDAGRDLQAHPDADEADLVIGASIAALGGMAAPAGVRPMAEEVARIASSIEAHRQAHPDLLDRRRVDQALATLAELHTDLVHALPSDLCLVHGDLHYLNVLRSRPDRPPRWAVIDPLPTSGVPEWEVTAALRNRWGDAVATGDPDRVLRRRLEVIGEPAGLDRPLAGRIAQAVAVDNLLWLLPREPEHMFVPPYLVIAQWTGEGN